MRFHSVLLLASLCGINGDAQGLRSQDLFRFRSVSDVQFSPDERHIAYTVLMNERPGRPYSQIWIMDVATGQDILYGVSAAVRRYLWIDRERMGIEGVSYGGQLSDWLITQTNQFKAAIPTAGISNLISYNYMTYYNQYEEMEFGQFFHQGKLMDDAWERSALKHVAKVHTPTMLVHGENDADVPIAEAEQYFVALKDVGVDTIFVRYPREGHGLHETKHIVDWIDRSVAWYQNHFPKPGSENLTNVQP